MVTTLAEPIVTVSALVEQRWDDVAALVAEAASWPMPERMEAEVLAAAADTSDSANARVATVVKRAATEGWVAPFLGHGARVDECLLAQPLEQLHPNLASHLRATSRRRAGGTANPRPALTPREQTILELLPTHLSHAQIGTRLFLSVNTVKMNLKSVYRKLNVTTRSQAVEAARAAGLL